MKLQYSMIDVVENTLMSDVSYKTLLKSFLRVLRASVVNFFVRNSG